ncbi:hypothetical protein [Bacillus thuringiensis]|nr:hypothetical protein [Bacillus thuringiensis]
MKLNWKLKVFTKKREISPASIMLDFKAEFYDEFEEEKKSSNCVF